MEDVVEIRLAWAAQLRQRLGIWWWYLVVPLAVVTVVTTGFLLLWTYRLVRGVFLPGNLQLELHIVEVLLLLVLGLDLLWRALRVRRGAPFGIKLGDGTQAEVTRRTVVGRQPGGWGIEVTSAQVSARHLEIEPARGGLRVRDLGSANGTYLDGDDLRGRDPVVVRPGDTLELGLSGPCLVVAEAPIRGLVPAPTRLPLLLLFLAAGLFLGWRANTLTLPEKPLALGSVMLDFSHFTNPLLVAGIAVMLGALILSWRALLPRLGRGLRSPLTPITEAVQLLLVLGAVLLYALLPAQGLRYGRLAEDRFRTLGPEVVQGLEEWNRACAQAASSEQPEPPLPSFAEDPAENQKLVRDHNARYQAALRIRRLACNLAATGQAPPWRVTYFRQVSFLLLTAAVLFLLPLMWTRLRTWAGAGPQFLARPLPLPLRPGPTSNGGAWYQRLLASLGYWDVVVGILAALVVVITVLTPLGTDLGRGKTLYLRTPLGTVQSIEIVKALFLLFMTGYFARAGRLVGLVPRFRYLLPFLLATGSTLAMTAVQADMGGLLMLGLLVSAMFILGTGAMRLLLTVPALVALGASLAFVLDKTSIIVTRLAIWLDPQHHARGEQVVNARQLLLSSGWTGYVPERCLGFKIPDIHGDLAFVALAERYGWLGLVGLVAALSTIVVGLLVVAKATRRQSLASAYLLAGVAVLLVIQVATQAGGAMGLMPFTGVPLPWLSQGLTASLIFTFLIALALAAGRSEDGDQHGEGDSLLPDTRLGRFEAGCLAVFAIVVLAAAWWQVAVPLSGSLGSRGAEYRWVNAARLGAIEDLVGAGVFVRDRDTSRVRLDAEAYGVYRKTSNANPDLVSYLEGLRYRSDGIRPLPYMFTNPNQFARRPRPRGWILARERSVLAMNDSRGRRVYPLTKAALHAVGVPHGAGSGLGVEARASDLLSGVGLSTQLKLRAFAADIHHGADIELTLDPVLQRQAYSALDGARGAAVVMDIDDGALLALVSSPAPDPDQAGTAAWARLVADQQGALLDRATASTAFLCPPGSTFKIVMAAAALISEGFDPDQKQLCEGYDSDLQVRCAHRTSHGNVDLPLALTVSCNIYFARLAVQLGPEQLQNAARRFGFNPEQRLDLAPGLDQIFLPVLRSALDLSPRTIPSASALARVGYGQGPVDSTPLQMARVGAVFATGGKLVDPYLVQAVVLGSTDSDGKRLRFPEQGQRQRPPGRTRAIPGGVAKQINRQLRAVFEKKRGTASMLPGLWYGPGGWKVNPGSPGDDWEKVAIAGKTGSAWREVNDPTDDAWMVAWTPAGDARVVVCVMIEDGGSGGRVAGPIVIDLMRTALERLGAEP